MLSRLLQLSRISAKGGGFFRLDAEASEPTIYLYTMIGKAYNWETDEVVGCSDEDFINALAECRSAPVVHLRVNSPGGNVFQAKAMQTAMMQYPGKIVAHVDSLAASAAAGLVMYASEIEMSVNAFMMIHKAWGILMGNADDLRDLAGKLDQMDESIAADFARKTGIDEVEIMEMMKKTTYIDAKTAKEKGFCDSILEPEKKIENRYDLSIYGAVPESLRIVKPDKPAQARESASLVNDRRDIERRLACIERIAA